MRLSRISNLLARSFIVFLIAYLWLEYYLSNIILVFVLAFAVMTVVNWLFWIWSKSRDTKQKLTREQQKHLAVVTLQLKFMSKTEAKKLFDKAGRGEIVSLFHKTPTVEDIISCVKKKNDSGVVIAAEKFPPEVVAFCVAIKTEVTLLDASAVYQQIFQPSDVFPEITVELKDRQRLTWAYLRQNVFARTKARTYVILGIIILGTSLIVRLNFYYIVVATVMFAFALVSLVAKPVQGGTY